MLFGTSRSSHWSCGARHKVRPSSSHVADCEATCSKTFVTGACQRVIHTPTSLSRLSMHGSFSGCDAACPRYERWSARWSSFIRGLKCRFTSKRSRCDSTSTATSAKAACISSARPASPSSQLLRQQGPSHGESSPRYQAKRSSTSPAALRTSSSRRRTSLREAAGP